MALLTYKGRHSEGVFVGSDETGWTYCEHGTPTEVDTDHATKLAAEQPDNFEITTSKKGSKPAEAEEAAES